MHTHASHTHTPMHTHSHMHAHANTQRMSTHVHADVHVYTDAHACIRAHSFTRTHTHLPRNKSHTHTPTGSSPKPSCTQRRCSRSWRRSAPWGTVGSRHPPVIQAPLQLREEEMRVELVDGGDVGEDQPHHVLGEGPAAAGFSQQLLEEHLHPGSPHLTPAPSTPRPLHFQV